MNQPSTVRQILSLPRETRDRLLLLYATFNPSAWPIFLELAEAELEAIRQVSPALNADFLAIDEALSHE